MPKALTPRRGGAPKGRRPAPAPADLPRDVVEEIQRVTRPTEVRDAVSRLSRAIGAAGARRHGSGQSPRR